VETAIAGDFKPTPESVFPSHSPTSQNQGSGARLEPERLEPARIPYAEALELYQSGRYAETVARLETLPSNHPAQTEAVALMARALANQGQLTEALDWCDRVIANDKLAAAAHYLRASILQEQGRAEEAMASLHRALYLDPDFILAHFALANLARSAGDSAKADKHFENALALARRRPDDEILLESEGISARRLSEIITALREMETAT
jgi:chemotaxis protein methyltransferase CheR